MTERKALAGCVIIDERGHVLLLHRNTPEIQQWELPGGKIEEGESSELAAVREAREELGVEVAITRYLGSASFVQNGVDFEYQWFATEIVSGRPEPQEAMHDNCSYYDLRQYNIGRIGLSPNVTNLVHDIQNDEIVL
jgi:8-oxo-dGTP diphosphatase